MEKNIGWHAGALSKEDMEKAIAKSKPPMKGV
jgi:hypothetical protein